MKLRTIFWFWLPLALSFLMMTVEGPWVQGVISRKPDPELQLAAFGLIFSLSVTIEAPVIMFLAVGSALAHDRQAHRVLWRYTMAFNVLVTVIALLMAFTPLLDLYLGNLLGIPRNIIEAVRPAMGIMVMWSGFIGYRRYLQGILIVHGRTKPIGTGTLLRVVTSAGIAFFLGSASDLPGAVIGAYSLVIAVFLEMLYIHIISRPDVRQLENTEPAPGKLALTYGHALRFHLPLGLTSLMMLLMRPVVEAGLAAGDNPELTLAAYPIIFSILLIMRAGGLAWQEVVIALSKGPEELRALRRFTWIIGLTTSGLAALFASTALIDLYTRNVLGVPEALQPMITIGTLLGIFIPLLSTLQSYLRALMMRIDTTRPIIQGVTLGFICTAIIMGFGVQAGLPGIPLASVAVTGGMAIETLYLWQTFRTKESILENSFQLSAVSLQ